MAIELEKTPSSYLPFDILEIILLKSPSVKSLLRFKTVCKSWNTIISDPVFVRKHLEKSKNSPNNNNLFLSTYKNSIQRFSLFNFEGPRIHAERVEENIHYIYDVILCECNGVLLLKESRRYTRKHALWNPSTRNVMYFEGPPTFRLYELVKDHGVCYDAITDDFKVVFVYEMKYAIYSCNNRSWTEKKTHLEIGNYGSYGGIFVDGAIYWVSETGQLVVYFDPRTDELKTLQKPEVLNGDEKTTIRIASLRGSLYLYCDDRDEDTVRIWIKEKGVFENCWNEYITIENLMPRNKWWLHPLCFVGNEILIRLDGKRFVYYSPSDKTFEEFEEIGIYGCEIVPYSSSLYFPHASYLDI
ncbi:hypothetical protein ACP275_14G037700 [Erythranthe tilingii]